MTPNPYRPAWADPPEPPATHTMTRQTPEHPPDRYMTLGPTCPACPCCYWYECEDDACGPECHPAHGIEHYDIEPEPYELAP